MKAHGRWSQSLRTQSRHWVHSYCSRTLLTQSLSGHTVDGGTATGHIVTGSTVTGGTVTGHTVTGHTVTGGTFTEPTVIAHTVTGQILLTHSQWGQSHFAHSH